MPVVLVERQLERPPHAESGRHRAGGVLYGLVVAVPDLVHGPLDPHGQPPMGLAEVAGELVVLADEQVDVDVDRMFPAQLVGQRASGPDIVGLQQAAVQVEADVGRHVLAGVDRPAEEVDGLADVARFGQLFTGVDQQCGTRDGAVLRMALLCPGRQLLCRRTVLLLRVGACVQPLDVVRGQWSAHPATVNRCRSGGGRHLAAARRAVPPQAAGSDADPGGREGRTGRGGCGRKVGGVAGLPVRLALKRRRCLDPPGRQADPSADVVPASRPGQRKPSGNLEFGTAALQSVAELLCGVRPEAVWLLAGQPAPRFDRPGAPLTGRRCGRAWRSDRPEDSLVLSAQANA